MSDNGESNDHSDGTIYVKFGPRPNQEMPIEWAEDLLTLLASEHQRVFSQLLPRVALGRLCLVSVLTRR